MDKKDTRNTQDGSPSALLATLASELRRLRRTGAALEEVSLAEARVLACQTAVAAWVETLFRQIADRSWQSDLIRHVTVVAPELARPGARAPYPGAALWTADIVLNYDWVETVYGRGLAQIDSHLVLAIGDLRPLHSNPRVRTAEVTLLRVGDEAYTGAADYAEFGIAAIAGGSVGYARAGVDADGALGVCVKRLMAKLHRRRIHAFDLA